MEDFTDISRELNSLVSKTVKKDDGIFFTPKTYRHDLIRNITKLADKKIEYILEPSFGSGEFIADIHHIYKHANVFAVEKNHTFYEKVSTLFKENNKIKLFCDDFIEWKTDIKFDLIIGNPPYVVVKTKNIPNEFKSITTGRPNLYCWFLYKCINLLNDNGILGFVIPNSILNTSYYDLLRKYIKRTCIIEDIIQFDISNTKFMDTEQSTIGIILRKSKIENETMNTKYWVSAKTITNINIHYQYINDMLDKYPTLDELGIHVKTGNIVWNQMKDSLVDDDNNDDAKLLIYTSNIKNGVFVPLSKKNGKKQYILSNKNTIKGPVILMNRGYGNSTYNINILFVDENMFPNGFYAENHLNVIYPVNETGLEKINLVYEYMKTDEFAKYIKMFVGNGALSKTEIQTLLPICC